MLSSISHRLRVGNLTHTLWNFPHLKSVISEVTRCLTKPNAAMVLLSIDSFPTEFRPMVIHILFINGLLILRKWRGSLVPNISDVKFQMNLTDTYEHCLVLQLGRLNHFQKKLGSLDQKAGPKSKQVYSGLTVDIQASPCLLLEALLLYSIPNY